MCYTDIKNFLKVIIIICFLIINNSSLFSQINRIESMGNLFLVIEDEDNNLNLYDRGGNSAFLLIDEPKDWLKINLLSNSGNGSLHKTYEPAGKNNYSIHFEALKNIDENQTFKGIIDYYDYKRKDVYRAIQTNIYGSGPFFIADSTTGTIDFYGPKIAFEYNISFIKDLYLGLNFSYGGEKGIKKIYSKPEITNRYISGQISMVYQLNENIFIGAKLDPFYNYEKIELVKDPDSGTDPITFKYRGFKIFRKSSDDYTRHNRNKGFDVGAQSSYKSQDQSLQIFISGSYFRQGIEYQDGTRDIDKEGYWQEEGYKGTLETRYRLDFLDKNLLFGLGLYYRNFESWSKHPQLPIIFSENKYNSLEIGTGFSYNFTDIGLLLGIEYHKTICDSSLNDYLGNYNFDGSHPKDEIRIGAEYKINNNLWLRLGYIRFSNNPDNQLNEFKFNHNLYSFGASYLIENYVKIDFLLNYGKKESKNLTPDLTYKETSALLFAKFFVF